MGCGGSKTSTAAAAPAKSTLLDSSAQPWKPTDTQTFSMFLDAVSADCLVATEDGAMLRVEDVEGGAIGLWNNRGRTEKVRKGDFVTKVRRAGSTEWVAGDAKLMLAALMVDGVLEAEVKRAPVEEVKEEVAPVTEEAPVVAPAEVAEGATVEVPLAEPVKTSEETAPKDAADSVAVADVEVEETEVKKPACTLSCF